jgi:translation initiation factor eIF-2B subunit epsilon
MVGDGTLLGAGVSISDSVIGRNCRIGDGVVLNRAYIWDNVIIEKGCKVSESILSVGVCLKERTILSKGCVLCDGVTIGPDVRMENIYIRLPRAGENVSTNMGSSSNCVKHESVGKFRRWGASDYVVPVTESDAGSATESDADMDYGDDGGHVQTFFSEVLDNFKRGIVENISTDNLILEVNSMKLVLPASSSHEFLIVFSYFAFQTCL